MKKLNLIFSMLLICSVLNAQDWSLTGNTGTTAGTNYLGTTDNASLVFKTWGTEQMRLLSTGELGLGTTTPSNWLHIVTNASGTINAKETFRTDVPTTTESNWRMYRGTSNMFRLWHGTSGNDIFIQALRGGLKFSSGNTGTTVSAMEIVGGTSSTADGNVIIGDYATYTPSARLHIKGNGYASLYKVVSSTQTTPTLQIEDTEQHLFKSRSYTGSSTLGAFDFEFTPGSTISNGIGIKNTVSATNTISSLAYGLHNSLTGITGTAYGIYNLVYAENTGTMYGMFNQTKNTKTSGTHTTYGVYSNASSDRLVAAETMYSVYGYTTTGDYQYGIGVLAQSTGTGEYNLGLEANATGISNTFNKAITAVANGSTGSNYGLDAYVTGGSCQGVRTITDANANGGHYALSASVIDNGYTGPYFGVFGQATTQTCASGSGTAGCAGAAGYFVGDLFHSAGIFSGSDAMLKQNVIDVPNAVSILSNLNCKQYTFDQQNYPQFNLPGGQHYGFIAQEVAPHIPGIVKEFTMPHKDNLDSVAGFTAFKAVNYEELIPLLVQAIKEQQAQIDSLIASQTPIQIPGNKSNINQQRIELNDKQGILLNQNDPNPFSESTRISYSIPEDVKEAKIIFTSNSGAVVNTAIINERGVGQLEVYSSELSKGIYNYTLVCDGKIIASKKMVKQ